MYCSITNGRSAAIHCDRPSTPSSPSLFLNYNMAHGWYLTAAPIITANWLAASDERWTVPIGGGFGRVFKVGDQPVNASIAGYYNAIRPTGTPAWQLRASIALLFPVK